MARPLSLTCRARGLALGGAGLLVLVLAACANGCAKKQDAADAAPPAPSSIASTASASASASAAPAPAPPPVATGVVTLVLQHVSADCGGTGGWGGSKEGVHSLGTDILLEVQGEASEKPHKEFAFCPSQLADGGAQKPKLSLWQYCRAFPSCHEVPAEGGSDTRVEIQCGKENLVLESDEKRTILRGSFGEREIAPHPVRIAPVKREERHAMVDC